MDPIFTRPFVWLCTQTNLYVMEKCPEVHARHILFLSIFFDPDLGATTEHWRLNFENQCFFMP